MDPTGMVKPAWDLFYPGCFPPSNLKQENPNQIQSAPYILGVSFSV